jgi:hypothetical protein
MHEEFAQERERVQVHTCPLAAEPHLPPGLLLPARHGRGWSGVHIPMFWGWHRAQAVTEEARKALKLKQLIIEHFIPPADAAKLRQRASLDPVTLLRCAAPPGGPRQAGMHRGVTDRRCGAVRILECGGCARSQSPKGRIPLPPGTDRAVRTPTKAAP